MKTIKYELEDDIATLTFDEPGSAVNTMCVQWQQDMTEVTAQVLKDRERIRGILLASAKATFFAGADLKAVMRLSPADAHAAYAEVELLKKKFRTLETLGLPVVSCLNGAAAVLIGSEAAGKIHGFTPRARIVAAALSGADPTIMLTGPMPAARKALAKAGLTIKQIDLFEVNEAFAAVVMRFMKEMKVPHDKVNVNGGAIAMGHPLGATGAMILNTLIDELHRRKLRYGLATLCVGGGMGIATIVERI